MTDLRQRLAEVLAHAGYDTAPAYDAEAGADAALAVFAAWLREHALIRDAIVAYEWTDPRAGEKRLLDPAEVAVVVRP